MPVCGAHNFHSIYEFLPVGSLNKASEMVIEILKSARITDKSIG